MPRIRGKGDDPQEPEGAELPSTLRRSDVKAQRTFASAHRAALEEYGDETRARRVAFAAVKHTHEKVGDHWEPKLRPGPSDEHAAAGGLDNDLPTAGGVDTNASKEHLLGLARRLGIPKRSSMTKAQLVDAVRLANDRATRAARTDGGDESRPR